MFLKNLRIIRTICSELYISIVITLLSISSWSVFVLFFRPIYYWSVSLLHIEQTSGFSKERILENYNALIDYFFPWVSGTLSLPSLTQSTSGIQHFCEVKDIFNLLLAFIPIMLILLIIYFILTRKNENLHYLKTASIVMLFVPLIVGIGFLIDFNRTFTIFHKIFFRNNYWLFDPSTDPVIQILPENFFMLCGIIIILFQFLMSLLCFLFYRRWKRKSA